MTMKEQLKAVTDGVEILLKSIYKTARTLSRGERIKFSETPGQEVIILGNGPSLNEIDLQEVARHGMEIACVNYFPTKNEEFWRVKPKYLVLFDPGFYLKGESMPPEVKKLMVLLEKVDWELRIVGIQGETLPIKNENIIYEPVNTSELYSDRLSKYLDALYKRNILNVGQQNVVIGAGYYFVCKRVKHLYYAGIDMSEFKYLFVDENNEIYTDAVHNYGTTRHRCTVVNKGEFYKLLRMYQRMFEQFYYLARFAERQNVPVTNLSINSYVDVFEKKPLFRKRIES